MCQSPGEALRRRPQAGLGHRTGPLRLSAGEQDEEGQDRRFLGLCFISAKRKWEEKIPAHRCNFDLCLD